MKSPSSADEASQSTTQMTSVNSQSMALHCDACGNKTRFIEVMDYVENRVDGERNHLHLIVGIPDSYFCEVCGARIAEAT